MNRQTDLILKSIHELREIIKELAREKAFSVDSLSHLISEVHSIDV